LLAERYDDEDGDIEIDDGETVIDSGCELNLCILELVQGGAWSDCVVLESRAK
jgi:hypothetical protein